MCLILLKKKIDGPVLKVIIPNKKSRRKASGGIKPAYTFTSDSFPSELSKHVSVKVQPAAALAESRTLPGHMFYKDETKERR